MATERLTDRFGRDVTYVRLSVTDRCNFRCVYCMPADGIDFVPREALLTYEEIVELVTVFARLGVDSIRLTGGEPLVRADVPAVVRRLKEVPGIRRVALTTNAFLLGRFAKELADAGLDDINVSLDSLDPETFRKISRVGDLDAVIAGIDAAREAGIERIKLNTVVMGGINDHELADLTVWAAARGVILRFIEFMPIGGETHWGKVTCVPAATIREALAQRWEVRADPSRHGSGPARYWRLFGPPFGPEGSTIGIIGAVTECFCAACNRVRVSSKGGLRACLADDREVDLRVPLRTIEDSQERSTAVETLIREALFGKKESHAFDIDGDSVTTTLMHAIGG